MKKKKLANLLTLGLLLFVGSILLWNCEKEVFIEPQTDTVQHLQTYQKINAKEIPEIIIPLRDKFKLAKNSTTKNKSSQSNIFNLLDLDSIVKIKTIENDVSYSIRLKENQDKIINVVAIKKSDDPTNYFVYEYTPTSLFLELYNLGIKSIGEFKGELNIYSIEEYIEKQSTQEKSSSNPCGTITFDDVNTDPTGNTNTGSSYYDCIISIIPHHVCPYGGTDHDPSACGPNGTGPGAPYYTVEWDCTLSNAQKTNTKSKSSSSCGGGSTSNPTTPVGINEPTIETCDDADCKCPTGFIKDINTNECVEYDHIFNELTGKEKCLNDSLTKSGNNYIKNILKKFQGDKTEFDINIKSKDKVFFNGKEANGLTSYKSSNKLITIRISKSKLSNAPALSAVRTLIHEYIHADIIEKVFSKNSQKDLDFKTAYESFEKGNFKASLHHETMAKLYINSISEALKSFHKNILVGDYDYLTDKGVNPLPDSFYEAIAWQGLKEHGVKAYIDLSNTKKKELTDSLNKYYHITTKNCPK